MSDHAKQAAEAIGHNLPSDWDSERLAAFHDVAEDRIERAIDAATAELREENAGLRSELFRVTLEHCERIDQLLAKVVAISEIVSTLTPNQPTRGE